MNLPQNIIAQTKLALQSGWSDLVTVKRSQKVGNVMGDAETYKNIKCHFSKRSLSVNKQSDTVATTISSFTLYVDTDVVILPGDTLKVQHKGQTFNGIAGDSFHGNFSNTVVVEVRDIS